MPLREIQLNALAGNSTEFPFGTITLAGLLQHSAAAAFCGATSVDDKRLFEGRPAAAVAQLHARRQRLVRKCAVPE